MTHFSSQLTAVAAAFLIMAGSFGAVIIVPPAQAHSAVAAAALA